MAPKQNAKPGAAPKAPCPRGARAKAEGPAAKAKGPANPARTERVKKVDNDKIIELSADEKEKYKNQWSKFLGTKKEETTEPQASSSDAATSTSSTSATPKKLGSGQGGPSQASIEVQDSESGSVHSVGSDSVKAKVEIAAKKQPAFPDVSHTEAASRGEKKIENEKTEIAEIPGEEASIEEAMSHMIAKYEADHQCEVISESDIAARIKSIKEHPTFLAFMTEHETDLDFGSGPQTSEGSTATKPFDMPENFENDFAVWQEWLKKHEEITSALDRRIGEIKKHPLFDQFIRETWPSDADPDCVFGGDPEEDVPAFESWLQAQENTEDAETAETQEVGEQQQHRFPQPPTSDHPDINRILESAAEIMMGRISKQLQHVHDRLRSLPDELTCGDFFSGAGTFAKVVDVAFHAFQQAFPDAMSGKTVNHKFMCEKEHFKQQFLLTMFDGPDYADTCLFTDATTCFSAPQCARHPSRSCVMPQGPADGLLKLLLFNAGFSCKSFSKLHKDYKNLLQAIYEGNEESSSNVTFRASLEVLKKIFVTCFILENLDLQDDEEDGRGNFENIIKLLEGAGSAGQIAWPLAVPDDLQQCEWFQSLSFRERENVLFLLNERDSLRKAGKREVRFGDVYQSAHRVPKSSEEEIPTSLPSSKLWDLKAERLLIGSEMLHLQAIQFPEAKLRNFSSPKLINLAGNAYTATVMLALVLSTLMHLESPTPSEQEDEEDVGMLVQAVAKRQRLL